MGRLKYILVPVFILAMVTNCADLDLQPLDTVSEGAFFKTEVDFKGATLASYSSMQSLYATTEINYPAFNEWFKLAYMTSDMVTTDPGKFDFLNYSKFRFLPTDGSFQYIFVTVYQGIHRANLVLEKLSSSDNELTEAEKTQYEAEARFLRGWFNFLSYNLWGGNAPLLLGTRTDLNDIAVGNSTPEETVQAIIDDFTFASANLPAQWGDENLGRATSWAAQSYLGKIYLYTKDYENARIQFEDVYNNGPYALMPDYASVFDYEQQNNQESIFEIQFASAGDDNGWVLDDFHPENFKATQGFNRESDIGIFDGSNYEPSAKYLALSDPEDPRLDVNIYRNGDTYYTAFESFQLDDIIGSGGSSGALIKKYRGDNVPKMAPRNGVVDYNNDRVFRFADLILMYSESLIESDGDLGLAADLINEVRLRSYPDATPVPTGSSAELTSALRDERARELFFEGHRYFDLVRWGIAQETFDAIDQTEGEGVIANTFATRTANGIFPLPQQEIDKSGGILVQVPGL